MRTRCMVLLAAWLMACTTATVPPPARPSLLSADELDAAHAALARGDAVITILGPDGAEYVGSALVRVHTGDFPSVDLAINGRNPVTPVENFGGDIVVPSEYAYSLASDGWNFTMVSNDPEHPNGLGGQRLHARLDTMEMRADPNGLFFATLHMTDVYATTQAAVTVTVTGRLIGGCDVVTGGSVMAVADPATVAECAAVIGGL